MKILHVGPMADISGKSNVIKRIIKESKSAGHDIENELLLTTQPIHDEYKSLVSDEEVYIWKYIIEQKIPLIFRNLKLRLQMDSNAYDVILVHDSFNQRRKPFKEFIFDFFNAKKIYYGHGNIYSTESRDRSRFEKYDGIIAISHAHKFFLKQRYSIPGDKTKVIYHGLTSSYLRNSNNPGSVNLFDPGRFNVVFVGWLNEGEGAHIALKALDMTRRDPVLHFVGDGPERQYLRDCAGDWDLSDQVEFHGNVANPVPYYQSADVVLNIPINELFGLANIEAGAQKKPVIATEIGGIPEIIDHMESGILLRPTQDVEKVHDEFANQDYPDCVVDPHNKQFVNPRFIEPEQLAESIDFLAENPEKRREMGSKLHERILRDFTQKNANREIIRFVRQL